MTNIVEMSPAAKALMEKREANGITAKISYPFDDLEPGKSFTFAITSVNWKSLRVLTYKQNKLHAGVKEFAFIKHDDIGVVEVARIA